MQKQTFLFIFILGLSINVLLGQTWDATIPEADSKALLDYICADDKQGRNTGSVELNEVGRYLAERIAADGWQPLGDEGTFFQKVPMFMIKPGDAGKLAIGDLEFPIGEDAFVIAGQALELSEVEFVFVGFGLDATDYENKDLNGKVALAFMGEDGNSDPRSYLPATFAKAAMAAEAGASGLVEINRGVRYPLGILANRLGMGVPKPMANYELPVLWVKEDGDGVLETAIESGSGTGMFSSQSAPVEQVETFNVVGVFPGSDPALKDEYILMSAHYDHVGVGGEGPDTIYNGARDNGMGVVAITQAARAMQAINPGRSIIYLACTAEEKGLVGSNYFANNPPVDLSKVVFNINVDGAGYETTDIVSAIGYGRTGTDSLMQIAAGFQGLELIENPSPEQGLYDRSDNVSFAQKGIPNVTWSPGFREFGPSLMAVYHQPADNPDTVDAAYLEKFVLSYTKMVELLANWSDKAKWIKGDKYEEVWAEQTFTSTPGEPELYFKAHFGRPQLRSTFWHGKLIFSGTETAPQFPGYMDGAVLSGQLAAKQVVEMVNQSV